MGEAIVNPIIEGSKAIFHWAGINPPIVAGDFNDWKVETGLTFKSIGANLWQTELDLPINAYMEYAFFLKDKRVPDPLNSQSLNNGVGSRNHYFYMPEAAPSPFAKLHRRKGKLTESVIVDPMGLIGGSRKVYFYQPAAEGPFPLLVVLDGVDYLQRGRIVQIIDSLIFAKKMQPIALAMIQNAGQGRFVEYACNDSFVFSMEAVLIPAACEALDIVDPRKKPGSCGILGASMGGTASIWSGLRAPHVFGKVLAQSSAFSTPFADFSLMQWIKNAQKPGFKPWMNVGTFDFLLDDNRRALLQLQRAGFDVTYSEGCGGHNFTYWRDTLPDGLRLLFPPSH